MATRYHLLPSQVLLTADSLDFLVMDVASTYQRYQMEQERNKNAQASGAAPVAPQIPVNKLKEMVERVRNDCSKD